MTLENIIGDDIDRLPAERTLVHGVPVPSLSKEEPVVKTAYIDDGAVLGVEETRRNGSVFTENVLRAADAVRAKMKEKGFLLHKEQYGDLVKLLGMQLVL